MRELRRFRTPYVATLKAECSMPYRYPAEDPNKVMQTLWTHGKLSVMEKLSLCSFMDHGHEVHLYTYEEVQGVPPGVILKDANEILPMSLYSYKDFINNGTFADYFRYKLLYERGGWWVDTDLVCIKHFDQSDPYVFGNMGPWEGTEGAVISNNCMKAPAGSNIMCAAWLECCTHDPTKVKWSVEVGPVLIDRLVKLYNLQYTVRGTAAFNPVNHQCVRDLVNPAIPWVFGTEVYAIHLWNDMWSGRTNWRDEHTWQKTGCPPILQSKDEAPVGSLYGDLLRKHLPKRTKNLLIAISSCEYFEQHGLNQPMRDTWLADARRLGVDYKFFTGINSTPREDTVILNVPDDYQHMSHKTQASLQWALEQEYEYVLRVFPDTYCQVDRLLQISWDGVDYWGDFRPGFFCCGGHGYCLSKKAMKYIVDTPICTKDGPEHVNWNDASAGAEDIFVGLALKDHKDIIRVDARDFLEFAGQIMPGPEKSNIKITAHLSDVENVQPRPNNYTSDRMYAAHERWLNSLKER